MEISNSPVQIHRNWLDLPRDVTLTIMEKLDVCEKLKSAQFVCKMWYILCKEPSLWRTLRIRDLIEPEMKCHFQDEEGEMNDAFSDDEEYSDMKMMYNAVDRSKGSLIELNIEGYCTRELLSYALSRSSQLKRLRLARCSSILFLVKELKELEKLSSLEQLVLTFRFIPYEIEDKIIPIISSGRFLTGFGLNKAYSYEECDEEALAIAAAMPNLRQLQLVGNSMSNVGLTAILDGCPLLQFLDLRECYNLDLAGDLGKRLLETIKDLRLPKLMNEMEYYDDYDYISNVDLDYASDYSY